MSDTVDFSLTVGQRDNADPIGPDAYGYWAYDNTDLGYPEAPVYNWIEIDPNLGGAGTQVSLGDYADYQDKSRTVTLPFSFSYYGQSYSTATICSNGWVVMGSTYLTDYRNWTLPSPGGPNGVIAVFWDDLVEVAQPRRPRLSVVRRRQPRLDRGVEPDEEHRRRRHGDAPGDLLRPGSPPDRDR